jgi:2,3-diaminopropionate biosynthesis protein SbnA
MARFADDLTTSDPFLQVSTFPPLRRLYLKFEGLNVAGSVKLKTAKALIASAEWAHGPLEGRHLVESSSGNLGVALACICASRGYPFTCVADPNSNRDALATIRAFGGFVDVVTERDANGGYLGTRLARISAILEQDSSSLWLNQYANPANPQVHQDLTAREICDRFAALDYLFVGVGTGGTMMGCARGLRQKFPRIRIVAVDAVGSVTFGGPPATRRIPGLGASRKPENVDPSVPDDIIHVPEASAIAECRLLARSTGLLAGGSTGSVLAALRGYLPRLAGSEVIIAISPDGGQPYLGSVYDDDWVGRHSLWTADAEQPRQLEGGGH